MFAPAEPGPGESVNDRQAPACAGRRKNHDEKAMTVRMVIDDSVPPLVPGDSCARALAWMEELGYRQLPVVQKGRYLGLVSDSDLRRMPGRDQRLDAAALPFNRGFVYHNQHVYDALRFAARHRAAVVPVLDEENRYAGLVTALDLIACMAELHSAHAEGGILLLETDARDYLLTEIARLVEANDAAVLSLGARRAAAESSRMEITLKVNRIDLTRIVAAFNRSNYKVTGFYHQSEFPGDLQARYDAFMKYLNT
jgi:CBS domain-containing protein